MSIDARRALPGSMAGRREAGPSGGSVRWPAGTRGTEATTPTGTKRDGRTLVSYLLLPRPKDAPKGAVLLLAYAIGAVGAGHLDGGSVAQDLVCWLALELLVYQARYQWNDVRGFAADQRHPDRDQRGRLPGPIERARTNVTASVAVLAARLLATGALVLVLPGTEGRILLASSAGVFGVAVVYELIRARATGRTSEVPPPLRPALVGLWVVVGAGYAVRGLTGLALATGLWDRPLLLAAAGAALWGSGVAYATTAWALEATAFARFDGEDITWRVDHRQEREHQLALVRWLPKARTGDAGPAGSTARPREWCALRGATPLGAPWNVAVLASGAAAGLAGRLLAGQSSTGGAAWAMVAGAIAAAVVLLTPRRRPAVGAVAVAAMACLLTASGAPRPVVGVLPWAAVVGAHLLFSSRSLATRGQSIARCASQLRDAARWAAHAVTGRGPATR